MIRPLLRFLIMFGLLPFALNASETTEAQTNPPDFDSLWNFSDPAGTEEIFQEIYLKYNASASESYMVQLLTQIARTQGLQGEFEKGFASIAEAEKLHSNTDFLSEVRILLETGRLHNSSGDKESAKKSFLKAKDIAIEEKLDLYAIDAVHMLGIVDSSEKQLEWNMMAIKMTENTEDKRAKGWLGPLLNNTGWSFFDMGNFENAMELFQKSLKWREEINDENGTRIAKWTIARTFRAQNKFKEALEIQLDLESEIDRQEIAKDGYVYEELGEIYLALEATERSKHYFNLAFPLLSSDPWLKQNEADRLTRIKELME